MPNSTRPTPDPADGQHTPGGTGAWYCKRRQLLRELPPKVGRRLRSCSRTRGFQIRDVLFSTEATAGMVHIVLAGRVRLAAFDRAGEETQLAILEPGEAFREPAHAAVQPLRLYAEALAAGEMLSLDLDDLRTLVERDPLPLAAFGGALS